jgi:hypothetical protein
MQARGDQDRSYRSQMSVGFADGGMINKGFVISPARETPFATFVRRDSQLLLSVCGKMSLSLGGGIGCRGKSESEVSWC